MNLPAGISYYPRSSTLFSSRDGRGLIRIDLSEMNNKDYEINDRVFDQAIAPYLHGDWADFDRLFQLRVRPVVYAGAEHRGDPKSPNLTVVPNLSTEESRGLDVPLTVFGCTMGHFHPGDPPDYRIQEVYEFQSYGLMALDYQAGEIELWVAKDGDKVAVPSRCHMTLYNLGDQDNPLITLDFANPERNPANKNLVSKIGPVLLAYYDDFEASFILNRLYINSTEHQAGVQLVGSTTELQERQVKIQRSGRLELGRFLYEQLTRDPDVIGQFARLGLRIRRAAPEVTLEPVPWDGTSRRLYFSLPLVDATRAMKGQNGSESDVTGTKVYRYFFPNAGEAEPTDPPDWVNITVGERSQVNVEHEAINPPFQILVEGAGDWVEEAFRDMFKEKVNDGHQLHVYYADDTRWKGEPEAQEGLEADKRPDWVKNDLQPWEIYLDKADPGDYAIYCNLHPNVVFIVTPDFTHSEIARQWLDKTPLILVEKPFDSNIENVLGLVRELGLSQRRTYVRGLDHYCSYAFPLRRLLPTVETHLGGCLQTAVFYMTEDRLIKCWRVRTVQYGLMLDMLSHLPALLTFFGDVGTIDEIIVIAAGQYDPLECIDKDGQQQSPLFSIGNETCAQVVFTFQDYSGNLHRVPCLSIIGKGLTQEAKYLEVTGRNGNGVRIDFGTHDEKLADATGYRKDSIFFWQGSDVPFPGGATVRKVPDPYDPDRTLDVRIDLGWTPLDRGRYRTLLEDLLRNTGVGMAGTFPLAAGLQIVEVLDRIWRALQHAKPAWEKFATGSLDPVGWFKAFN